MAEERVKDRRVHKTRRRLRDALVSLIHEKSYDAIVVKEILERADVGRTAFYTHFRDKDALLASGIHQMLHATASRPLPPTARPFGSAIWFSLPVFEYVEQFRHAADPHMGRRGRALVHSHLRRVLLERIAADVTAAVRPSAGVGGLPTDLVAEYVVATFILVLNWWVDSKSPLLPRQVDDLFLALVLPTLASASIPHLGGEPSSGGSRVHRF
jgi:AcrR family transcriptional regulator